jgi:hypothetical protein
VWSRLHLQRAPTRLHVQAEYATRPYTSKDAFLPTYPSMVTRVQTVQDLNLALSHGATHIQLQRHLVLPALPEQLEVLSSTLTIRVCKLCIHSTAISAYPWHCCTPACCHSPYTSALMCVACNFL